MFNFPLKRADKAAIEMALIYLRRNKDTCLMDALVCLEDGGFNTARIAFALGCVLVKNEKKPKMCRILRVRTINLLKEMKKYDRLL